MTAEQPTASDGAIFQAAMTRGKFQGNTAPATPAGSLTIKARCTWTSWRDLTKAFIS
jgi:hypothetical protein